MLLSAAAGFLLAVGVFRPWQHPANVVTTDPGTTTPRPEPAALLALATGAVEVLTPGQEGWLKLGTGGRIEAGAQVRTPPQVRCEFLCPDGSEIRINGDAEVHFRAARQLGLNKGQIMASVAASPIPFQVRVGAATITALGTQFDVWSQPEETRLAVLQGATRVQGQGPETTVATGEVATIVNGQVTDKRPGRDLLQATRWVEEILVLKGRDNPELAHRVEDILAQIGETKTAFLNEEEIRRLGYHCVVPLSRYLQSERSHAPGQRNRRAEAAGIVADLAQPWSIPDLIDLLADDDPHVRYHAAKGLARLTSQTLDLSPEEWRERPRVDREAAVKAWRAWWEKHKDRYPRMP